MASTRLIREALAAALVAGLGDGYQVSAYALASPTPPAFEVLPGRIDYHATMGSVAASDSGWRAYRVRGYFSLTADIGSQQKADQFFEDDPVLAALEADRSLGGVVDDLIVDTAEPAFFDLPNAAGVTVGAVWMLRVFT